MAAYGMNPQTGQSLDDLQSLIYSLSLDRSNSRLKILRSGIPQVGAIPNLSIWLLQVFFSPLLGISANVIPFGSWEPLASLASEGHLSGSGNQMKICSSGG